MSDAHIIAGSEAVECLACALLRTAGQELAAHRNDPNSGAILAAAIVLLIERANTIDPRIRETVRLMMEDRT